MIRASIHSSLDLRGPLDGPFDAIVRTAATDIGIHGRVDVAPSEENYEARDWQLPHQENQTGTANAYRPKGSVASQEKRPEVTGDYEAWSP